MAAAPALAAWNGRVRAAVGGSQRLEQQRVLQLQHPRARPRRTGGERARRRRRRSERHLRLGTRRHPRRAQEEVSAVRCRASQEAIRS